MQSRHMECTGLNMHLHKIGLHTSGLCDFCEEPETVKHHLFDCLKYQH